ncbi:hypothetical protein BHM03_00058318, partial [Ensete ventricosum]
PSSLTLTTSPPLPLSRRRLPLPVGSLPANGRTLLSLRLSHLRTTPPWAPPLRAFLRAAAPCRRQLLPSSVDPMGGCLYSLASGYSHFWPPLLQASRGRLPLASNLCHRLAMAWLRAGRGRSLLWAAQATADA